MIPFNKVYYTGKELEYINQAIENGKLSGNGPFTKLCQNFFERKFGFKKALLTTSCTDALEMCAMLAEVGFGDEVIVPSYTFVSSALPFLRQGAKVVFADSSDDSPNINPTAIEALITSKTKAIVVVHYAGIACNMEEIMKIAEKHQLIVIEDAAQAIDSFYIDANGNKKVLGSIGHLAAFSFHETKNIVAGEGGMLVINDSRFVHRSEIIWEKGTNRAEFIRGEVNKYGWVDIGSSFLASELIAAFLWAQLEQLEVIQNKRKLLWETYDKAFKCKKSLEVELPNLPNYATNNGHMYYIVAKDIDSRDKIINRLKTKGYSSVFHYISLHSSPFYHKTHDGRDLPNSDKFTNCLLRLPLFYELSIEEVNRLVDECF